MNLSFQLGIAYQKASQGQKVTEYNALVDIYNAWIRQNYNAWIRQNFDEDAHLFKPKMNETAAMAVLPKTNDSKKYVPPMSQ